MENNGRVKEMDGRWVSRVVERNYKRIFTHLLRLSGRPDVAQDLTEETFLRLFVSYPEADSLQGPDKDKAATNTLYKIAQNKWRDYLRREKCEKNALAKKGALDDGVKCIEEEATFDVRHAVANLPEEEGDVIILHYYEGLTYKEIAELREITVKQVQHLLEKAREHLRAALVGYAW
jgi:RNA polymerase sigma-70 factor (ECF subfamily)